MKQIKILAGCLLVAFAVTPALASASVPHWYTGSGPPTILPQGQSVELTSKGILSFHLKKAKIKCALQDKESIENPIGGGAGIDSISTFTLLKCTGKAPCQPPKTIELNAAGLPWASHLLATTPIKDEINGIVLQERCSGVLEDTYQGSLTPKVGTNVLNFTAASGSLLDSFGEPGTIAGADTLTGPSGEAIKAKKP